MDSDSEQMFHDLEQRHLLLRKEHDVVCIEKEAFKGNQMVMNKMRKITTVTAFECQSVLRHVQW